MGRRPYTQKGSCRDKHYHSLLPEELMCEVCSEQAKYSDRYLLQMEKNSGITILGNCHAILGTLSPSIISKRKAYMEAGKDRHRKRCVSVYSPDHRMKSGKSKAQIFLSPVAQLANLVGIAESSLCTNQRGGASSSSKFRTKKTLEMVVDAVSHIISPTKKD